MKDIAGATVLVVEDDPNVLRAVQRILASIHEVVPAQGAREAEALLKERAFDIAIVDVHLPDASGYEVNRVIHELGLDTDVILMTGSTSRRDQKLFQALEDDAFYFLFKPFDRRVLIALVERCLRLRQLQEENRNHLERLGRDQAKAREIQRNLLPRTPLEYAGWLVTAYFEPTDEVSGDLYYSRPVAENGESSDDGLALMVADVVGHGLPAAMYGGMLRSALDAGRRLDPDPLAVFDWLLDSLDFFASNSGASLIYTLLSADGGLRYLNAGHPPALLQRAGASGELEHLAHTAPKLLSAAVIRDLPRASSEVSLEPGDRVLFFTDGLSEAESPDQREWGVEGVESAFRAASYDASGARRTAEATLQAFLEAFREHCGGRPVHDDVTVVLLERR